MDFANKRGITSSLVRTMRQYVVYQGRYPGRSHIFPHFFHHTDQFSHFVFKYLKPHVIQTIGLAKKLKGLQTVDSSSVKAEGHASIAVLKISLTLFKLWARVCATTNRSKGVTTTFYVRRESNNEK